MTSTASGVGISAALKSQYQTARSSGNVALIKVQIVGDVLDVVKSESRSGGGGWSRDFDLVGRHLDKDIPSFIIFFKSKESVVLLQYVPEEASVKHKMQYSASKSALNSMLNARQFSGSGASSGSSKSVEQYFATTPAELTHSAYTRHTSTTGPMSEVEEALHALPKTIEKKDFGKSMVTTHTNNTQRDAGGRRMRNCKSPTHCRGAPLTSILVAFWLCCVRQGYSLLATVSGKALPAQLKNYGGGGNAAETSNNLYKGGSMSNFYAKPSDAKRDNINKPQAGAPPGLPGWGATSPKNTGTTSGSPLSSNAAASPTATSSPASAPSPTDAATASALAASSSSSSSFGSAGRPAPLSVANGKCLVASCPRKRFKNGYCVDCLQASAQRREAVFAGTEQE